ncbi:hypothetical protein OKW31_002722 [Paraburkholderia atlantica]
MMHLVGCDARGQRRVSSVLATFNHYEMYAETSDGLTYQLVGNPGSFWDVVDVWESWCEANGIGMVTDVTRRLLARSVDDDHKTCMANGAR